MLEFAGHPDMVILNVLSDSYPVFVWHDMYFLKDYASIRDINSAQNPKKCVDSLRCKTLSESFICDTSLCPAARNGLATALKASRSIKSVSEIVREEFKVLEQSIGGEDFKVSSDFGVGFLPVVPYMDFLKFAVRVFDRLLITDDDRKTLVQLGVSLPADELADLLDSVLRKIGPSASLIGKLDSALEKYIEAARHIKSSPILACLMSTLYFPTRESQVGNLRLLFLAGTETTAASLLLACDVLAKHSHIQSDLRQSPEIAPRVVKELLRICPTAPFFTRVLNDDFPHPSGTLIPSGSTVAFSIWGLHHDKDYWTDPYDFKLRQPAMYRSHYLPFGFGSRHCLGMSLGEEELTETVTLLVQRFEISYTGDFKSCPGIDWDHAVMQPDHDMEFLFQDVVRE